MRGLHFHSSSQNGKVNTWMAFAHESFTLRHFFFPLSSWKCLVCREENWASKQEYRLINWIWWIKLSANPGDWRSYIRLAKSNNRYLSEQSIQLVYVFRWAFWDEQEQNVLCLNTIKWFLYQMLSIHKRSVRINPRLAYKILFRLDFKFGQIRTVFISEDILKRIGLRTVKEVDLFLLRQTNVKKKKARISKSSALSMNRLLFNWITERVITPR